MIIGGHSIIYSTDAEADRAFLRDVLGFPNVDVGGGWLIFGLPPAELAVHPSGKNDVHEFYLMCDDVDAFVASMDKHGVACAPVQDQGYGLVTQVTLPGGGKLGVYQPRHARPPAMNVGTSPKSSRRRAARKGARKTAQKALRKRPARRSR
jgi:catechol 2,3-dioxygenase-like lactoylglutathione lyase family enzyme